MSFLGLPLAGTVVGGIADLVGRVIDRVIPDPKAAADAKIKLLDMQQKGELAQLAADTELLKGQLAINTEEAKSTNIFVAGWRPGIGWTCAIVMFFNYVFAPLLTFALHLAHNDTTIPTLDFVTISPVLLAMLGYGGARTYEKVKGVA
ncbi:MAG: holin family protein [Patescibacteria group bacterium]|nr:holin family protein [Patescibacteria group bacterium]